MDLFPGPGKTEQAIALLRAHEPEQGYYGCFSGGKDSCVIKELAKLAGVKVAWHYNQTTIDPPELVRFIRQQHPDVEWVRPRRGGFFERMEVSGFPTRLVRWCCAEYKESRSPVGAVLILGVRASESRFRAARWQPVTFHNRTKTWAVSPILAWTTADVWGFIRRRQLPYCSLYDEGFDRLGCVGCPMAGTKGRQRQFARWPKFEAAWQRAFERVWEKRSGHPQRNGQPWFGDVHFKNWQEMWAWWMTEGGTPKPVSMPLFDETEEDICQIALDMLSQ